jgi:hypothetical protein
MTRCHLTLATALLLVLAVASQAQRPDNRIPEAEAKVLNQADQLVIYALARDKDRSKNTFYGRRIVDEVVVKDAARRKEILSAINRALAESDLIAPREFERYRHCIRAKADDTTVDLVISFDERKAVLFRDGKMVKGLRLTATPAKLLDSQLNRH